MQHRDNQGLLHNENGPAITDSAGRTEYWVHGVRHNPDGPALIWPEREAEYWVHGWLIDKEIFLEWKEQDGGRLDASDAQLILKKLKHG